MTAIPQAVRARSVFAAALLAVSIGDFGSPRPASAQLNLGSLIVTVTSPGNGATVGGTVPFSANVSIVGTLTVQKVEFKVDGVKIAEDTSAPYSMPWNTTTATNGQHVLTACARDSVLGLIFESEPITVTVSNDTTPPAVAMSAPTSGSIMRGDNTVSATASDNVGVVGVQFLLDGSPLGAEDTAAPYSISWATTAASNGSHTLSARARDAAGNTTTSAAVTITVDNSAPAVSTTAPTAGATVRGTISVTANASDNVGVAAVQFLLDGSPLGAEDTATPYAISWDTTGASTGSHTVAARARDAAGNTTTSALVTVTVDNSPPTVSLTSPANGATVSGTISVDASASDNLSVAGVQFFLDGSPLGAEDTTAPFSVSWNTTAGTEGSHTLTARARDAAGNTSSLATVTVTVANAPTITGFTPTNGPIGTSVTISGTTFNGATAVTFNGVSATFTITSSTSIAATVPSGATTGPIRVITPGGTATSSSSFTVTVIEPTVTRIEETSASVVYTGGGWNQGNTARPWSGGTAALGFIAGQRATLSFTGNGVSWIGFRGPFVGIADVYLDGTKVATIDTYAATETVLAVLYTASGLTLGAHTLAIEVTGTQNPASGDRMIIVDAFDVTSPGDSTPDTVPPTVSISFPTAGTTVSGTVNVTASATDDRAVAGVRFLLDGAPLGTEDTTPPYSVSWDTTTTADGAHTLAAVARDAGGNTTTSATVNVTVSNTAPPTIPTATRIEDTSPVITYTPGTTAPGQPADWFHGSRSRDWSDGTASFNRSAGARATFTFTGTAVRWLGFRAYWAGIANVYVDGTLVSEVDLFLPPCPQPKPAGCVDEDDQAPAFTLTGLTSGPHTLTIESTGRKHGGATCSPGTACSADYAVVVDAFDITPASPPLVTGTRIEETAPALVYDAGWTPGDTTRAWSGGTARVSTTTNARATVTFTGTELRWIGLRGPTTGIANVFLDGAFHARVDTYSGFETQSVVFAVTGLAPARHTVVVEVTGQRNAAASNHLIVVDAFDVRARVEERDATVAYTGTWTTEDMSRNWSGTSSNTGSGTAARSATAGATADFTFKGTAVDWIGFRGPIAGIADVFLDGTFVSTVDLYAATSQLQAPVFSATGLSDTTHTLRIVATGNRNPAASAAIVVVDAFDIALGPSAPSVARVAQTDPAVTYSGTWTQSNPNNLESGRTVAFTTTAGARADFSFTGTGVRWIGHRRRDAGIARVSIDGLFIREVDLYAPMQDEFQAAVFSATGLAPGAHTLTIEVTGTKRGGDSCAPGPAPPCSSGYLVVIDAFDIQQ